LGAFLPGALYILYFGFEDFSEIGLVAGSWFPAAVGLLYLVRCLNWPPFAGPRGAGFKV
jgi:hypothetical protein